MTVHESPIGATVEWYTPPWLFDRLGLTFDLDPASPESGPVPWVPAARFVTPSEDGLYVPWVGRVWLNPPYGGALAERFVRRMVAHGRGLLLVAARTETRAVQAAMAAAHVVCFLRDRLHFVRPDGTSGRSSFASALLSFGDNDVGEALIRADLGWTVVGPWGLGAEPSDGADPEGRDA